MSNSHRGGRPSSVAGILAALGIALAIALALSIGVSQGRQSERRYQSSHQHAESAKSNANRACVGREPAAMFECVYEQVERADETARAEQDLTAQQQMSLWTLLMIIVSAVTAIIAGVALWYVRETLVETRAMTIEAQNTTKAAETALTVTQGVAAAELRAWISINVRVVRVRANATGISIDYEISFVNIGQTAARSFDFQVRGNLLPLSAANDAVDLVYAGWREPTSTGSRYVLMPTEEHIGRGAVIASKEGAKWKTGTPRRAQLAVIASAFYWSALDNQWHRTDRSFTIGQRGGELLDDTYIFDDLETDVAGDDAAEKFVVKKFRAGETT